MFLTINVFSLGYYANIEIFVDESGRTTIDGLSNLDSLDLIDNSFEYTSKKGSLWTLNITTKESLDNFIYELNLPKNSEINYIKTTPTFRIVNEDGGVQIIGTGEDKPLTIIVQYKFNKTTNFITDNISLLILIGLFLSIILFLRISGFKFMRNNNTSTPVETTTSNNSIGTSKEISDTYIENEAYDYNILSVRQKDIIDILKDKGKISQKELELMMDIPKSSVSRNVRTLEIKNIIKKESVGKINYLSLNK
jgi:hypothetical protein